MSHRVASLTPALGTHPLLAQVPLTVSPFIQLPTSTTLPYTYKPMPSALPPSATGISAAAPDGSAAHPDANKPRYVVSQSGHAAHPDDIIASCRALQAHIAKLQADAERDLRDLDDRIAARELAEKRRVAPGWLDSDARLLEPERVAAAGDSVVGGLGGGLDENASVSEQLKSLSFGGPPGQQTQVSEMAAPSDDEGAQMDRAFGGGLAFRPKQ